MKLTVSEILSFTHKAVIQEQHNVDQPIETMVIKADLVEECMSIQEFSEKNTKILLGQTGEPKLTTICIKIVLN